MSNTEGIKDCCAHDIYECGIEVFETTGYEVGVEFMASWVNRIAELSGERVDFHKSGGGTWTVKAIGDIAKVNKVIQEIKPEYDKYFIQQATIQRLMELTYGLEDLNETQKNLLKQKDGIDEELEMIEIDKTKILKEHTELIKKLHRMPK